MHLLVPLSAVATACVRACVARSVCGRGIWVPDFLCKRVSCSPVEDLERSVLSEFYEGSPFCLGLEFLMSVAHVRSCSSLLLNLSWLVSDERYNGNRYP